MLGRFCSQLSFNNLVLWKKQKMNLWQWKESCYRLSNSISILSMLINLLSRYMPSVKSQRPYYMVHTCYMYNNHKDQLGLISSLVLWRFTWWAIEITRRRKNKRNGAAKLEFCEWFVLYKPLPPMGTSNYCNLYDLFSWKNSKGNVFLKIS